MSAFHMGVCILVCACLGCGLTTLEANSLPPNEFSSNKIHGGVFEAAPEDVSFFKAIGEDQEKRLSSCKTPDECRAAHYLRGVAALYENRELAALHFRKVVVSQPSSVLAQESRFWLWLLDVLNAPDGGGFTSEALVKRLTREIVEKELLIHELSSRLENSSVEALQKEVAVRTAAVEELNTSIANLTKQVEQYKKEQAQREDVRQELKASKDKIQELTGQLEALRRIDQELKEKAPPTRPSEKMTPVPEVSKEPVKENTIDKGLKIEEELKKK